MAERTVAFFFFFGILMSLNPELYSSQREHPAPNLHIAFLGGPCDDRDMRAVAEEIKLERIGILPGLG